MLRIIGNGKGDLNKAYYGAKTLMAVARNSKKATFDENIRKNLQSTLSALYDKQAEAIWSLAKSGQRISADVFNYLVGKTISLPDGDVKSVKNLPGKRMYKELYNRQPKKYKGVNDDKQLNSDVNYNMKELLENSDAKLRNVPDKGGRHVGQGIIGFDTGIVTFYDGSKAYNIESSIANLMNGEKVAYAKKFFGYDA